MLSQKKIVNKREKSVSYEMLEELETRSTSDDWLYTGKQASNMFWVREEKGRVLRRKMV